MKLLRYIAQNLVRNRKNLMFSSIGLVVGVSTFIFFVALGRGVQTVVLEDIFVIRQIEVVPRSFDLAVTQTLVSRLDTRAVDRLARIQGVVGVYPKMKFTFPAWATGGKEILGKNFRAEVVADGVPPELLSDELQNGELFVDWEAEFSCRGEGIGSAVGCPEGKRCLDGHCTQLSCNPDAPERFNPCKKPTYCAKDTRSCEMPLPIVANPTLLTLYNSSLTTALAAGEGARLPKLTEDAIIGFTFDIELGRSYLGDSAQGEPFTRKAQVVGFSTKAIQIGFTLPIQYVKRFNARFTSEKNRDEYHSVILVAESNDEVAAITKAVKDLGYDLDAKHAQAERLGLVITIVTLIFSLISLIIVTISAINIAHTFLMIIAERRREIGILRALGASRNHTRFFILGEAGLLGVVGGGLGIATGVGMARLVDFVSTRYVPDFPFKPASFFIFDWTLLAAAMGLAVFFCLLGAFIPANRAAGMEPARAFTTQ
ncbi:MAG: ABC transporter permease [Myxococcota bacterium]|nr:ABC transporter permease [Myxococcota bacterium]